MNRLVENNFAWLVIAVWRVAAHFVNGNGSTPKVPTLHRERWGLSAGATSTAMFRRSGVRDTDVLAKAVKADAPRQAASRVFPNTVSDPW